MRTVDEFEDLPPPALTRDPEPRSAPSAASQAMTAAATQMLLLGIKTLSQKTVVALASLFTLLTAASVFVVAFTISGNPTTLQLVLLGLYSCFVILLEFVRRR